ncbi:MAG: 5'-methylthioadenosine/adenosylhomocysteine nucleosidase [Candidatus Riflebacteria bacterium]|nr:5'-methylthioadenosine/adenosylhomocysteine nucleosidase [Candidatus Riflebacteria bacterium]
MKEEIAGLVESLRIISGRQCESFIQFRGRIFDVEVGVALCGIGKVNAAVGTALFLQRFKPDYLINIGVAGGFSDRLSIGDIVISSQVRHHDADATAFAYEFGQIPQMPVAYDSDKRLVALAMSVSLADMRGHIHNGEILSGDSFVTTPEQIEVIARRFPNVMAVEMEGAAVAQTSYLFRVPFVLIRAISDNVHESGNPMIYEERMGVSAGNSIRMILGMLKNMKGTGNYGKNCKFHY